MKNYTIKPEYLSLWGEGCTEDTVITENELQRLAQEWEKSEEELLDQLREIEYIPVGDAELRQEGSPSTAYWAVDAVNADERADEDGTVELWELVYYGDDPERIDWDNPDVIRATGYSWIISENRRV